MSNLSVIRGQVISILRRDTASKIGAKNKRFKAALDSNDILDVLQRLTV